MNPIENKSLDHFALKSLSQWIFRQLENAQLQQIDCDEYFLAFQFYKYREFFLVICLKPKMPCLFLTEASPIQKKIKKPVSLFLNAHAKNKFLSGVVCQPRKGRVVDLYFSATASPVEIEIILIPGQPNIIVRKVLEEKSIAWNQPKELLLQDPPEGPHDFPEDPHQVDDYWQQYCQTLHQQFFLQTSAGALVKSSITPNSIKTPSLGKKKDLLVKLELVLQKQLNSRYQVLAEKLKYDQPLTLDETKLLNPLVSRIQNSQKFFDLAKKTVVRNRGLQERISILKKEIEDWPESNLTSEKPSTAAALMNHAESSGRKKQISPKVEIIVGKSALDNLKILRASRAWDYFLHLRDQPGAYGILVREKGKPVTDSELREAGRYLIQQSLKKNKPLLGRFEILWTECRHVRPLKGAKPGTVSLTGEKVFVVNF